ncbi:hypothetical protein K1719_012935 [Acacia pycnantha]|nr:hypothetical protein K1719_012935 [Acacia pycnantha]
MASNSTVSIATSKQISLRVIVDKEKNTVLYAEAGKDFVDVLLSFLTLPLGTIARLVDKDSNMKPLRLGCISSLYQSLANLEPKYWNSETRKQMLLQPRSSMERFNQRLKLNIDDTEPTKFYACEMPHCRRESNMLVSTFNNTKCKCGGNLTHVLDDENIMRDYAGEGYVQEASFVVYDNLHVMPLNLTTTLCLVKSLRKVKIEDFAVNIINPNEVIDLLKWSLVSNTVLTDSLLRRKQSIENPKATLMISEKHGREDRRMKLNIVIEKSKCKVLFAIVDEDFMDQLLSFLTIPLGAVERVLGGNSGLGCIDKLYNSLSTFDGSADFMSGENMFDDLKLAPQYNLEKQMLPISGVTYPSPLYLRYPNMNDPSSACYLTEDNRDYLSSPGLVSVKLWDPKHASTSESSNGYLKRSTMFMVADDLSAKPFSSGLLASFLNESNVCEHDLEERTICVGVQEVLNILKASLLSTSALTMALAQFSEILARSLESPLSTSTLHAQLSLFVSRSQPVTPLSPHSHSSLDSRPQSAQTHSSRSSVLRPPSSAALPDPGASPPLVTEFELACLTKQSGSCFNSVSIFTIPMGSNLTVTRKEITVRIVVDTEENKVLYAEAGKDFVDVVLSFLTLPLGTIARLVDKDSNMKPLRLGCISSLYQSLANLEPKYWNSERCKQMLLQPRNSMERFNRRLKLNIDDTEPTKFYACEMLRCRTESRMLVSTFNNMKCKCGKNLNHVLDVDNTISADDNMREGYVREACFVVYDDLRVMPLNLTSTLCLLKSLRSKDKIVDFTVNIGPNEVMDLLKCSMVTSMVLTHSLLRRKQIIEIPKATAFNNLSVLPVKENKRIKLNVMIEKSKCKVLFAIVEEDFMDQILSFLSIPLGAVERLLQGNSGLGCIDKLYNSLSTFDESTDFVSGKNMFGDLKLAPQYKLKKQMLPISEVMYPSPLYLRYLGGPGSPCYLSSRCIIGNKSSLERSIAVNLWDPKLPSTSLSSYGYVKSPRMFMVADDLSVKPFSSRLVVSCFNNESNSEVSARDLEERTICVGVQEVVNILKASLISTSALTTGLGQFLTNTPIKEETKILDLLKRLLFSESALTDSLLRKEHSFVSSETSFMIPVRQGRETTRTMKMKTERGVRMCHPKSRNGYAKRKTKFMVADDLTVKPLSSLLTELKVPCNALEQRTICIGVKEVYLHAGCNFLFSDLYLRLIMYTNAGSEHPDVFLGLDISFDNCLFVVPVVVAMASNSTVPTATSKQISLRVIVDKEKNTVLYAEAGKDFVDVLLSFLTLPLGTIARLVDKDSNMKPLRLGCISSLYQSVANLEPKYWNSETWKQMLLQPRNSMERFNQRLKLNIDDTEPTKFYACEMSHCRREHHMLVIDLLKCSLVSNTVLTDSLLRKKQSIENPKATFMISEKHNRKDRRSKLNIVIEKSKCKVLFAIVDEDFMDQLLSFLTIPLGAVERVLQGNSGLGCIDKLYKSLTTFDESTDFMSRKNMLADLKLAPQYNLKKQMLPISEVTYPSSLYLRYPNMNDPSSTCYLTEDGRGSVAVKLWDPKHLSTSESAYGYCKRSTMFMVADNLSAKPFSSALVASCLNESNVCEHDLEERTICVGVLEVANILKASLLSTSALTMGLAQFLTNTPIKEEK